MKQPFKRNSQHGPVWLWLLTGIGAIAMMALIGFVLRELLVGDARRAPAPRMATAAETPAQPVPTYTPTPGGQDAGALATTAATPGGIAAVIGTTEPTPVPALEGQYPPPQRTITLEDIAPGSAGQPVPTPAPPTPTPTVPPDTAEQLAQGEELLRMGDAVAARSRFAALLDNPTLSIEARVVARYNLAKAYLTDGYYSETLNTLDQLEADYATAAVATAGPSAAPTTEREAEIALLRGMSLIGLGRGSEAIAAYTRALELYPQLAAAIEPRIAQAHLAAGDSTSGAAAYRRAADAAGDVVQKVILLESLAQTHANAGRYSDAVAAYEEILSVAQNPGYRAQIQYRAGETLLMAGDLAAAISRWQAAIDEAPATNTAHQALVRLVENQVPFDLYRRGMINLYARSWLPAVNAFTAYIDSAPAGEERIGPALLGLGQAYLGLQNGSAARDVFTRLIEEYPNCDCFGQAWLSQADAYMLMGDGVSARRTLRTFARDYPTDPLAGEALWKSGELALNTGNEVEAAVDFLALADAFPNSDRAPQALYTFGVGAFANDLFVESADALNRLQTTYPDYRWDATGYWLGRARAALGNRAEAQAAWQAVVDRAPDIYYGVLAAQALRQLGTTQGAVVQPQNIAAVAGPPTRLEGDDGSRAFAEQWLADWLQVDGATLSQLPASVTDDPDWTTGKLLLEVDERGEALVALERIYNRHQDDSQALYALSLAFEELGAYRLSLITMARLLQFSPAQLVEDAPIYLQQRAYPQRFKDLITAEAQTFGINPLLYFSLIRQESLFEEGARSTAAAQGLAQIIPDTGAWVAQQLSYPNYTNNLVYRPYVNVKFGAYYLNWVRDYLDGNLVSAVAGYNGGPGSVDRWRAVSGADDALFVEVIDFRETRVYVQAIVSNLYHYTRLYGEQ